jgi:hypothetical protein
LNEASKQDLRKGLVIECMSPEESETDSENGGEVSDEDDVNDEQQLRVTNKKIVVRPLSWRSKKFTDVLESLDRKWNRRASTKSRAMARPRHAGQPVRSNPPEGISSWMMEQ